MFLHSNLSSEEIWQKIRSDDISFGGNLRLKIYGTLRCKYGLRMKQVNRIFFASEGEARLSGYRPCGHCMKQAYQFWKNDKDDKHASQPD